MARKRSSLGGHALLQATVTRQADYVMIENGMFGGVEGGGGKFGGDSHANGIANALTKGTGGTFDSGGFAEFRMAWRLAVQLAEIAYFLHRQIVTQQMEPRIEKHAAVACGENETITVDPIGIVRVYPEGMAKESGSDLGGPEGKTEVTRTACVNSVDG